MRLIIPFLLQAETVEWKRIQKTAHTARRRPLGDDRMLRPVTRSQPSKLRGKYRNIASLEHGITSNFYVQRACLHPTRKEAETALWSDISGVSDRR